MEPGHNICESRALFGFRSAYRSGILGLILLVVLGGATILAVGAETQVVRAGFEDIGPPFSFRDANGQPTGHAVELMRAVAKRQHLELQIVMKPWGGLLEDFDAGRIDLLGNVGYLPERTESMAFSASTVVMEAGLYVRRGEGDIHDIEALRGRRVLVLSRSVGEGFLAAQPWGVKIVTASTRAEAIQRLIAGDCDVVMMMRVVMDHYLRTTRTEDLIAHVPFTLPTTPYHMHVAVRKNDQALLAKVNEGLLELARDGEDVALFERWIGPMQVNQPFRWTAVRYYILGLIGLALALLAGGGFYARQRKLLRIQREQTIALRRSEGQLQTITNLMPALVSYIDRDRHMLRVNRVFEEWFKRPLAEIQGRRIDEVMGAEAQRRMLVHLEEAFAGKVANCEGELLLPGGVKRWVRGSFTPSFNLEGEVEAVTFVAFDVTDIKQAQQELVLRGFALEAAANAIVITDTSGRVLWANAAFTGLTGYTLAEVAGRVAGRMLKSGQHDRAFYKEMWGTITAGKVWRGDVINRKKSGQLYTEEMTITPLFDEHGAVTRYIAIKQDTTERRDLERRYLHAQRQESLGRLASGIAHDLNNVLTPVIMIPSMLRETIKDPALLNLLNMVETSAQRGRDLLRQLLLFGRGGDARRESLPLAPIAQGMSAIVRETFPRNIRLETQLAANLPLINVDPTQIHQVLMNLCVNARDAMPEGGRLTISLERRMLTAEQLAKYPGSRAGAYQVLAVSDTGCGIAIENQDLIFEPFFTTKPVGEGTGLGLSTVSGIVRGHGGFIELESGRGIGTTFRVFLPENGTANLSARVETASTFSPGDNRLVLIVDDEPSVSSAIAIVLGGRGYRTVVAANGAEALQAFRASGEVAAVITDLSMPTMDGVAFISALRKLDSKLPVVAISGHLISFDAGTLAELPGVELVPKPFTPIQLLQALDRSLSLSTS